MQALVLFPHQLFAGNAGLVETIGRAVLVEDALFFTQYRFHKQKLVLHRASMQAHAAYLRAHGAVDYLDVKHAATMSAALQRIKSGGISTLHHLDVVDDWLQQRLEREAAKLGIALVPHPSPMFLTSMASLSKHFSGAHPAMSRFYAAQRAEHDILMEGKRPVGGQWSFDADNRKRLPRGAQVPELRPPPSNPHVEEARRYVEDHFPGNPGQVDPFAYPVNYADANGWLEDFMRQRLPSFGDYEDAISERHQHVYHSVLTPMLNIGLLTPRQVIDAALAHGDGVPLNSLEGFVRQVLGWREYVRGAYLFKGRSQRNCNFWKHTRPLPDAFWRASVNIKPIDMVIDRLLRTGYAHHIERLMLLANFMTLCEFDPDEVYRWFMELFIDAYDWVMVPNVYGMGLFADGGRITTKPYLCGSNYILKMSDLQPGPWGPIWDGLYWRFVAKHREFFLSNHRTQMTVRSFDRMPAARREAHLATAEQYLSQLGAG
jgi:deoxyribodipyrimidine photolyase-related protein